MQPAGFGDDFIPWTQIEMVRVGQDEAGAELSELAGVIALTVAWVPTGANTGVSSSPCGVWNRPARARPCFASILKEKGATGIGVDYTLFPMI
jgi:hypothetical protein